MTSVLRDAGGALLEGLTLFDVYRGPPLPGGAKSLAFSLRFRAPDRTLTDAEASTLHEKLVEAARVRLGATLRA